MGLKLQAVAARQGWTWARDGVRLYLRRPVAFSAMLLLFLLATGLWSVLPVIGLAALASLPLLSLGFMVASRSVLRGGLAHPGQFVEPLLGADARRRRSLLLLCALYGVGALVVVWWVGWVYGDAMDALARSDVQAGALEHRGRASRGRPAPDARHAEFRLCWPRCCRFRSGTRRRWCGGAARACGKPLFSSTLGMWRAKSAYLVYSLAWLLASMALEPGGGRAGGLARRALADAWLVPALVLSLSSAFYVSLWFSFVDNFGSPDDDAPGPPIASRRTSEACLAACSQVIGVSLATASASHLAPWRPKLTCARASSPWPSSVTITPSPNLLWNTLWPMRSAGPLGDGGDAAAQVDRRRA